MEQTVYQKLVATQKELEALRNGQPKPYWLYSDDDDAAYRLLMERYEKLMESTEAKAGLDSGSKTFEVTLREPGTAKTTVTADSVEEAFFKWMLTWDYDNPYGLERLPDKDGDTVEYEGIYATFREKHG